MISVIYTYYIDKDGVKHYDTPYIFSNEKIDKMNEEVEKCQSEN